MQNNSALKFLPAIGEDKKIDVSIENDEAVIKLSTWTESLGWNCQKTMRLDIEMLDELHRALTAARYRLTAQKAEKDEKFSSGNVIKFPLIS